MGMNNQAGNNPPGGGELSGLTERVTQLEMLLTHMQRTLHDLDQVALDQQKQLDKFAQQMARIALDMNSTNSEGGEVRTPEDEKPPHY